ncbi:MAG: hypothetical protein JO213_07195 [Alphaproteobacteria bacterium]|nr:hypothetical protein [Alphaproteobacteria bacterium]
MGYQVEDLSYFHEVVPEKDTYRVTKQLCADTNLPEFRRMLNRFVREVVVPKGKLRKPVAVQRFMNVRIMLPTTPSCSSRCTRACCMATALLRAAYGCHSST